MKKQFVFVIITFFCFSCNQENVQPEDPVNEIDPAGAIEIQTSGQISTALAITKTSDYGYAITGFVNEDETNFYPFFASISEDLNIKDFQSSFESNSRDYGLDILEASGNFFIVTHNLPNDLVYEFEGIGLTKLDREGNSIWRKDFFHNISDITRNELELFENEIYLICNAISDHTCFIAKFDLDGNLLDTFSFQDFHYASNLMINGHILFFASKSQYGTYDGPSDWRYTPYIVRSDMNGNIVSEIELEPSRDYPARGDATIDENGNIAVIRSRKILRSQIYRTYVDVCYIDKTGEIKWTKVLNNLWPEFRYLSIGCILTNQAGEIFVLVTDKNSSLDIPILLKFDMNGTLLKNQNFNALRGILLTDMVLSEDGMLVAIGTNPTEGKSYIIRINQDLEIL